MSLRIRAAKPSDLTNLVRMAKALDVAVGNDNPLFEKRSTPFFKKILFSKHPIAFALIAEINAQPVGYAISYWGVDIVTSRFIIYVEDLYVVPAYQKQGIARGIMEKLKAIGIRKKVQRLTWAVWTQNSAAFKFYKRIGAKRSEDSTECFTMTLELS